MSDNSPKHELPRNIEMYFASLSKLYAQEGKKDLQTILVNSKIKIIEGWSFDGWNGGVFGHAIHLIIPETLYLSLLKNKDDIEDQLRTDVNKFHNIEDEYVAKVVLELEIVEDSDWRKESGMLIIGQRTVAPEAISRIWNVDGYRVFLSHKAEVKKEIAALKEKLGYFGISAFVAHEDIHPTKEWQDEIENALFSMDAFVAMMTEGFHDSLWTDQEVGVAFGRGVPIISVKLGKDPYGFIGKFQALSCSWENTPKEIVRLSLKYDRMLNAYIKAVENCTSFNHGNELAEILPYLEQLSNHQVDHLVKAYNENGELRGSFGFNGKNPRYYGDGLRYHLMRITGKKISL